jgi:hypothetical protein
MDLVMGTIGVILIKQYKPAPVVAEASRVAAGH